MKSLLKFEISTTSLVVTNLFLMVMAIILEWRIYDQIMVFWCENLVIGFYTIFKLPFCRMVDRDKFDHFPVKPKYHKFVISPFFIIHFSLFCTLHLAMIQMLFSNDVEAYAEAHNDSLFPQINWSVVLISIFALMVNHGVSFVINFLGKKEYLKFKMDEMMMIPYKRLLLVHLVAMSFGIILSVIGFNSVIVVFIFFGVKIWIDLKRHNAEHLPNPDASYGWF